MGFKRSGKTTLGQALAKKFNLPFLDTDTLLLQKFNQQTISELFTLLGEKCFREEEIIILKAITQKTGIIALGGGTFRKETRKILSSLGKVIYLKLPKEEVIKRLTTLPLPSFIDPTCPEQHAKKIFQARAPFMEKWADFICIIHL